MCERFWTLPPVATGVNLTQKGKALHVKAQREVILSAGSVGSPQILQVSGIGPAETLMQANVDVLLDAPGVGANLQDHLEVYFQYQCTQPVSLNNKLGLLSKARIGTEWVLFKTGLGATNHFESCGFIRSRAGLKWPDIQYHFLPAAMRYDGQAAFDGHGYQVHVGPNKPRSRGSITIQSPKMQDHPRIMFNYLQDQQDVEDWRATIRLTREILQQNALAPWRGDEIQPGAGITSDNAIDAWVRQNVESAYHPSCTIKMGRKTDPMAPLDAECKVRGIQGLRVVDSSIFPIITNGNLNAPTIMVAEKAADIILSRTALHPSDVPVWIHPDFETAQR